MKLLYDSKHWSSVSLTGFVLTGIPVYYLTQATDEHKDSRVTCELWVQF